MKMGRRDGVGRSSLWIEGISHDWAIFSLHLAGIRIHRSVANLSYSLQCDVCQFEARGQPRGVQGAILGAGIHEIFYSAG